MGAQVFMTPFLACIYVVNPGAVHRFVGYLAARRLLGSLIKCVMHLSTLVGLTGHELVTCDCLF